MMSSSATPSTGATSRMGWTHSASGHSSSSTSHVCHQPSHLVACWVQCCFCLASESNYLWCSSLKNSRTAAACADQHQEVSWVIILWWNLCRREDWSLDGCQWDAGGDIYLWCDLQSVLSTTTACTWHDWTTGHLWGRPLPGRNFVHDHLCLHFHQG